MFWADLFSKRDMFGALMPARATRSTWDECKRLGSRGAGSLSPHPEAEVQGSVRVQVVARPEQ